MSEPYLFLACDHRTSLVRALFSGNEADASARAPRVKELVLEGLLLALDDVRPIGRPGLLLDAGYGGALVAQARTAGIAVALAVECSGQRELQIEAAEELEARLRAYRPSFAKVLVRCNPADTPASRERQEAVLADLSRRLQALGQPLMFELLVPPTDEQLGRCAGNVDRFDSELRPELTSRTIAAFQAAGVRSALYKLEGFDDAASAAAVVAQVHAGDPDAGVLVLGRGASAERVDHWLRVAAGQPGFDGFAIGRSIWWEAARAWLAGRSAYAQTVDAIAANYRHAAKAWGACKERDRPLV